MGNRKGKRMAGMFLAAGLILLFMCVSRQDSSLPGEAAMAMGLFLAAIVLWIFDVFPMAISAAVIVCLYPLFHIMTFKEAIAGFSTSSVIFIFGTFAITAAMKGSSIPLRITSACIKLTKGNSAKLIFVFCLISGILSGIMSSSAVCVMFWSISLIILKTTGAKPGSSNMGRALAVALPVASGMGGFITPAGTPGNILMIDFMESCGWDITFGQWTMIGLPVGLIGIIVFACWLVHVFPIENIDEEAQKKIYADKQMAERWSAKDLKTIVIICVMLMLWFLGSWIPFFNTATVAVIGMSLMFMPGIEVLTWKEMQEECNTNILLMIGLAPIIANALSVTGALEYLVTHILDQAFSPGMNPILLLVAISAAVCVLRAFIPTPAAVVSLLGPLTFSIATLSGLQPAAVLMIVAFWGASAMLLLYTEPIFFFTFGHGYYTEKDVLRCGWLPCMIMSIVTSVVIPPLVTLAGIV